MTTDTTRANASDTCEVVSVDDERVRLALKTMPTDKVINALAETFRSLSDPTRVRILSALSRQELCVCELASALGLTGSAVSHQLRLLRGAGLVKYRRAGKMVHYTLDDEHIGRLLEEGLRHVKAG